MDLDTILAKFKGFRRSLNNHTYDKIYPVSTPLAGFAATPMRPMRTLGTAALALVIYGFSFGCGGGGGSDGNPPNPPPAYACSNGSDDDGDGLTDMNDPGCSSSTDNDEYNTAANTPPVINGITMYQSIEGAPLSGIVDVSDAENNAVSCSLGNNGGLVEIAVNPDCSISSAGALGYDRSGNYNVTVNATDGIDSVSSTVPIAVADGVPGNNPPAVAAAFSDVTVAEDGTSAVDNVPSHFSDADGDALTYSVSGFSRIVVALSGNRLNISAPANWNGSETGSVRACDTSNACVSAALRIIYTPVNDAPSITSISMTAAQEGQVLAGQMNGADADIATNGDILKYSIVNNTELPQLLVDAATGRLYTAAALPFGIAGVKNVQLKIADIAGAFDTDWYTIVITDVNRPPVITSVTIDQAEEGKVVYGYANGSDPDGDPVTCYLVSSNLPELKVSPGCGVYSDVPLPPATSVNYNVVVGMTDGSLSATLSKDFEVQRPPTRPTTDITNYGVFDNAPFPLEFNVYGSTDPNGDTIQYRSNNLPAGATLNPTSGHFSWDPTCSQDGVHLVDFYSLDSTGMSSLDHTVTIIVNDGC